MDEMHSIQAELKGINGSVCLCSVLQLVESQFRAEEVKATMQVVQQSLAAITQVGVLQRHGKRQAAD
jgi:hypothetical protein